MGAISQHSSLMTEQLRVVLPRGLGGGALLLHFGLRLDAPRGHPRPLRPRQEAPHNRIGQGSKYAYRQVGKNYWGGLLI